MNKRRHELEENELASFLGKKIGAARDNPDDLKKWAVPILLGIIAICGAWIAVYTVRTMSRPAPGSWLPLMVAVTTTETPEATRAQLKNIAETPDEPAALWAQQMRADSFLQEGAAKLFAATKKERNEGLDMLKSAQEGFAKVRAEAADRGQDSLLIQRAMFGEAQALEALAQPEKAVELYAELAEDAADSAVGEASANKLAFLARKDAKGAWKVREDVASFLTTYEAFVPTPPPETTQPGMRPDVDPAADVRNLTPAPDLSFPGMEEFLGPGGAGTEDPAGGSFAPGESSLPLTPPADAPGASTEPPATSEEAAAPPAAPEGETPAAPPANEETPAPEGTPPAEAPAEPSTSDNGSEETPAPESPAPESSETPAP
ncbi:MAG TPA: hypothetical protein VGN57_00630 [Pirellulaceae bacterium]|jgi:hypothetical protein|nr:hypothetical protein [Pirellulaceae bacterium]